MNPLLNSSINFVLVGLSLSCLSIALVGASGPYVPAMYVFGDSLADAGTNNFIPHCTARANFPPYGISDFPSPTGRFSNGRTTFDILAKSFLRLPHFLPPFLKPNSNFSFGINFASGGSGLLNSTGATKHIIPMGTQIQQFEHFVRKKQTHKYTGSEKLKSFLAKSLYCISIGGNDIFEYLPSAIFHNTTPPDQFLKSLLTHLRSYIMRLYRVGARKFLILDISALGCTPYARLNSSHGECLDAANQLAVAYNTALKSHIDELNQQLDGLSLILLNSYDYFVDMIQHGEAYGLSETKSACCGSGKFKAEVSCGKTTPPAFYCNDTDGYLFWDQFHPTKKVEAPINGGYYYKSCGGDANSMFYYKSYASMNKMFKVGIRCRPLAYFCKWRVDCKSTPLLDNHLYVKLLL